MNIRGCTFRWALMASLGLLLGCVPDAQGSHVFAQEAARKASAAQQEEKAKAEIVALIDRFNKAINDGDVPGSVAVYDQDVESFPLFTIKYLNTEQRMAAAKRAADSGVKVTTKRNDDMKIHLVGNDMAWVHWTWHTKMITPDGKNSEADGRTTFILQKKGGDWWVVHSHISEPLRSGPPQPVQRPTGSE